MGHDARHPSFQLIEHALLLHSVAENQLFRSSRAHLLPPKMLQKAFPDNINLLQQAGFNLNAYDIIVFSYVMSPLNEDLGFNRLIDGLLSVEKLCRHNGRILIVQDKFEASLMRRIGRAIGTSSNKQVLTQYVYPKRNENETYTYIYYCCLYAPTRKMKIRECSII